VQRPIAIGATVAAVTSALAGTFLLATSCSDASSPATGADDAGTDASLVDVTVVPEASPGSPDTGTDVVDAAGEAGPVDASDAGACVFGDAGESTELRCTGLYSDWATKTVASDALLYDPGLHLWSDGAQKTRFIHLPPSAADGGVQAIDTSNMDEWTFPVGTKVWKEFVLGGKRIETRLLWKRGPADWYLTTYRWSADETSAPELTTGELDADGNGYEVPTQAMCPKCHGGRADTVLGFEAVSLASAGASPTLAALAARGWINDPPDASLAIPGDAVDVAALGYLHANCGTTCHNRGSGAARGTGFFLRLDVATVGTGATVQSTDAWLTGVNRPSYLTPPGASDPPLIFAPDDAGASLALERMATRTGVGDAAIGIQMPPIDTHEVDEAGVSTIGQWIAQGCQ
jgi:hypothetical protein